jgi:opacity protein-like surface antigen
LPLINTRLQPYIGIGVGAAMIENAKTQLSLSGTLGARMDVSDQAYIGVRYRFTRIQGTTDDAGIAYDAITFHTFSAVLGFYFS